MMIEKIARAIDPMAWDNMSSAWKAGAAARAQHRALTSAMAVLEAMREPSDLMKKAGELPVDTSWRGVDVGEILPGDEAAMIFIAMIDAAIAEHAATAIGNRRA